VDPVGASSGGGLSTTNSRTPTNIRNWRGERSRSDFDRTHVFTANGVWELPVGKGKWLDAGNGFVNTVIGGWALNGIYTRMPGEPSSVTSGIRTAHFPHVSRADIVKPVEAKLQETGAPGPVVFADASAFKIPDPGSDGAGRNIFRSPSYWNVDLSITKTFQLSERFKLDFRTEMFNAFNHTNFHTPRGASRATPTTQATVSGQPCCGAAPPPTTQTITQGGGAARVIQFALKVNF